MSLPKWLVIPESKMLKWKPLLLLWLSHLNEIPSMFICCLSLKWTRCYRMWDKHPLCSRASSPQKAGDLLMRCSKSSDFNPRWWAAFFFFSYIITYDFPSSLGRMGSPACFAVGITWGCHAEGCLLCRRLKNLFFSCKVGEEDLRWARQV